MTLYEELKSKCTDELLMSHDLDLIALTVNQGRVKPFATKIGKGTILGLLDLASANAFLDVIDNAPDFRHLKHVLANESFDVSLQASQDGIQMMVPSVLSQEEADAIKALGTTPDTVSTSEIEVAMKTTNGIWRI